MSAPRKGIRRWVVRICALTVLTGAGAGLYHFRQAQARTTYPNTPVHKGEFLVLIRCRGSLQARQSVGVFTPVVPGLRIAWIAPAGETVNAGDPIVRFDSSTAKQQLMQKESQLKQAQLTLDQALAQSEITSQQDQTEFADAKFSLERAQVQVEQAEIRSRLQGEASRIDLGVAEQKLKVQDATVALHRTSEKSRLASLARQRDQAQADVDITRLRISQMELKAPGNGLLTLKTNCAGAVTTADCKPYKVGDSVSSNMVLGTLPDLASLEMDAQIQEVDRGRISAGQDVLIRVDALPELTIAAKVRGVSSLAETRMEYPYPRSFRAYATIPNPDPRLRPDMNGGMDIVVSRIPNAISIPSKALFTRAGKPIVYLSEQGRYRAVEVEVLARNPDEVAISGIRPDSTVALVDVTKQERKK